MRLSELAREAKAGGIVGDGDPEISAIVSDSREAAAGALFAALPGTRNDGTEYIQDAVKRGAAALLLPAGTPPPKGTPAIVAADVRRGLGEAADAFHGHPARSLELVGVTGTNGKTTTAYLIRHILNTADRRCGMLGTIEYDLGGEPEPAPLTTPDAIRFTRSLAEMRDAGCKSAVVEVSSHALDQGRVWPHRFACAVFTNLTRDHLDYHGTMDAYREAKRLLFTGLDDEALAVVNYRDPAAPAIIEGSPARKVGFHLVEKGKPRPKDLPAGCLGVKIIDSGLEGQTFSVEGDLLNGEFRTTLVGKHNVENCAGALAAAVGLGVHPDTAADALRTFPGVPGRLERIAGPENITAFVDFAHTDDALVSVLSVLRPLVGGSLITVFGCGGDRDRGKRPLMAKAAAKFSDVVVVTSDNPRTEDPDEIINDILAGFSNTKKVRVDADREGAIRLAVSIAAPGDVILVAGKGHENYQIVGKERRHLDDRELVRAAFASHVPQPAGERETP